VGSSLILSLTLAPGRKRALGATKGLQGLHEGRGPLRSQGPLTGGKGRGFRRFKPVNPPLSPWVQKKTCHPPHRALKFAPGVKQVWGELFRPATCSPTPAPSPPPPVNDGPGPYDGQGPGGKSKRGWAAQRETARKFLSHTHDRRVQKGAERTPGKGLRRGQLRVTARDSTALLCQPPPQSAIPNLRRNMWHGVA